MPTSTDPCPPPSDLQKLVDGLAVKSKQQNAADAKASLVAATALASDVQKAESGYKKDYDGLVFANTDATQYQSSREAPVVAKLQPGESAQLTGIVTRIDNEIACNKKLADQAGQAWQAAQTANAAAQAAVAVKEPPYRAALAYTAGPAAVAAIQTRAAKELDGGNYRGAYVLLREMKPLLQPPLSADAYSKDLEAKAVDYFNAADAARQAKATLDQTSADAQATKKQYDDSVAKRLDAILKAVADEKFVPPPAPVVAPVAAAGPNIQPG